MAEIFNDLIEAYDDDLELRIDDTTFSWLQSHQIIDPARGVDESSLDLPAILISGAITNITPLCIRGEMEEKTYQITFTLLQEYVISDRITMTGDTYATGTNLMVEALETIYRRETFNLSDMCRMLPPISTIRPSDADQIGASDLVLTQIIFEHKYVDTRGDSLFRYIAKISSAQTLGATDSLTVTHPTMLVQSDGGAVTITATPTIAAGIDGQLVCVMGNSDTNYPTFQDASVLSGSGIKLKGKQSYTFGLNDSTWFMYRSSQSAWVEVAGRADVY